MALSTTVLGGFLGAGKTTLVNRLLRDPRGRRIAVMVNDFGAISIDRNLIESRDGPVVSLANGCVCCSLGGELSRALDAVLEIGNRMDHLLIEASGVADPDRIADIARAEPELSLDAVVTLVDAAQIEVQLADHRIRDLVMAQLRGADLLVLNKADMVTDLPRLQNWLRGVVPATPIVATRHSEVPFELVLGGFDVKQREATAAPAHDHEAMFARWAVGTEATLTHAQLDAFLESLPPDVLRLKGWVSLSDGSILSVQRVGPRCDLRRMVGGALVPPTQLTAIGPAGALNPLHLDHLFTTCEPINRPASGDMA